MVFQKIDSSVMNFGGETNTLSGIYVRGLQLDARQITVNGLPGLYSTYNSPTAAVSSAQLIKGASTAVAGMDPEGAAGSSLNVETKRATDEAINKIGLGWYSNTRLQESFDFGRRFGENKEWGVRLMGNTVMVIQPVITMMNVTKNFLWDWTIVEINSAQVLIICTLNVLPMVDVHECKISRI